MRRPPLFADHDAVLHYARTDGQTPVLAASQYRPANLKLRRRTGGLPESARRPWRPHLASLAVTGELVALIDTANMPSEAVAMPLGMQPLRLLTYDGAPHVLWSTAASSA